ncbi:hypothetical protein MMC07_008702 [Pseudocyphellaria aurata]|nr:hypothetical protein [Pseudocyphellaria aurata]
MSTYIVHPEAEEPRSSQITQRRSQEPFLPHSENDWLRTVNVDWARGFSDIVEIGSSKYDIIRIWQNDPNELKTTQPGLPPNSLVVRWERGLEEEVVLRKLRDPNERDVIPGHVTLLLGRKLVKRTQPEDKITLTTSSGSGASRFGKILDSLNIDQTFRSTLYKALPDFQSYEHGESGLCYHLKFPNLYRGEFAFAAWFNCKFNPGPQYPQTGHTNALIFGLTNSQIENFLTKLTESRSTVLRTESFSPSIVYHPLLLILCILLVFSEEDGSIIRNSIDQLKSLQQRIGFKNAQSLGDISIELNQLSSDLSAIQMGNTFMQGLGTSLLTADLFFKVPYQPQLESIYTLADLARFEDRSGPSNDYFSTEHDPLFPLLEQFRLIQSELELLKIRCEQRKFDIRCLLKQIDINLNVWCMNPQQAYNLLSQEENRWNRTISKQMAQDSMAMHQIALASKSIAEATKMDSYAMKTIAILTTIFLPGTFIAALFSTSMFDFDHDSIQVSRLFWVYWAVTIPLTVMVVVIWQFWLRVRNRTPLVTGARAGGEEAGLKED